MTLTAPGCPVAGSLPPAVQDKIETIDEVKTRKSNSRGIRRGRASG
jgi:metal-sulfur cluster biosynthetic enzyme